MRIERMPAAQADVDDIWTHIARDDPDAATRMVARIAHVTDRLINFPLSARPRPDVGEGVRSLPVGSYTVYYRVEGERVLILRVIHAARDVGALFDAQPPG